MTEPVPEAVPVPVPEAVPARGRPSRMASLGLGLALLLATLLAYLPVIQEGGFIWDDDQYVTESSLLQDTEGLARIWSDPYAAPQFYPLVHTTYWLEYQAWELDASGYHLTNVLLHALAALLLWRVLRTLKIPGAFLAAMLFALHPVHVESVAWITERKNVLSGVFYFLSMLAWMRWRPLGSHTSGRRLHYALALLCFALALLSKTVTFTLPAVILLLVWWRRGSLSRRDLLPTLPFFVLAALGGGFTAYLEQVHVGAAGAEFDLSLAQRVVIAGRAPFFYAGKLLWPADLTFNYPRWDLAPGPSWQLLYPAGLLAVLGLLWLRRARWGRGPLVGVLFFVGSLFPALGFINVYPFRYSFVADHFQYLSSLGLLVLLAAGLVRLTKRAVAMPAALAGLLILAVPLGLLTAQACRSYAGLERLWRDTLETNPDSWLAHMNLGELLLDRGELRPARRHFKAAIQISAQSDPFNNLGLVLVRMGDPGAAVTKFERALELNPEHYEAVVNSGNVLSMLERDAEAVTFYQRAMVMRPKRPEPRFAIVQPLLRLQRKPEAIQYLQEYVEQQPRHDQARVMLQELRAGDDSR